MKSLSAKWLLPGLVVALVGCGGGGSSQITLPNIVLATPSSTTVAAGATLQLSATVTNTGNTTVLWYVDGIAGGNGTVGTITPQGLYTAPSLPPGNGIVVISAAPQAFPAISSSISIGITFGNASLNGNYVFTLRGSESGSPWEAVGSFTGNNGLISNGVEDINGASGVSQALPFTGSYVIDANGQGTATFTSSQGSFTLAFALDTSGQATVMRNDSGGTATGNFFLRLPSALTITSLDAPYVFSFSGSDASGKTLNAIGTFVTNGSATLASAEEDLSNGSSTANQPFSGSYANLSNGRGTASFTDSTGTRSYTFYVVSPNQLQFIETDSAGHLFGVAFQQQSVTSSTTLSGGYVFFAAGTAGTSAYGAAGGFATNTSTADNINAGTDDINNGGSIASNASLTGSFTIGAGGRGTLSLSGSAATTNYVYYFITPNAAFMLSTDAGVNAGGELFTQTGGFSAAALLGNYALLLSNPAGSPPAYAASGVLNLDGVSAVKGFESINANGTLSGELSVSGSYTVTAATSTTSTRGTMALTSSDGASRNFIFYPISAGSVLLLDESAAALTGTLVSPF